MFVNEPEQRCKQRRSILRGYPRPVAANPAFNDREWIEVPVDEVNTVRRVRM